MLLSFIFALACSPDKASDTGDANDTGNSIDTANDTGEDSADTGDTSDTGSSDDTFVLDFEFVGELTASKLILVEFSFGGWAEGSAFDVFGNQVAFPDAPFLACHDYYQCEGFHGQNPTRMPPLCFCGVLAVRLARQCP